MSARHGSKAAALHRRVKSRLWACGQAVLFAPLALALLAGCASLSGTAPCQSFTIPNDAMSPAYRAGQVVLVDTQAYSAAKPRRGHVVVVNEPASGGQEALRVIGLPGETVRLTETQTFINGQPLDEPFVLHRGTQQPMEARLGADEYFLMGDNRLQSRDSRAFGAVPLKSMVGEIGTRNCPNN